jgi:hypothetical protein
VERGAAGTVICLEDGLSCLSCLACEKSNSLRSLASCDEQVQVAEAFVQGGYEVEVLGGYEVEGTLKM